MRRQRRLCRDRRGAVMILFPFLVILMCVMAAFAVDTGYTYANRSRLQSAADAAALAACRALRDNESFSYVHERALEYSLHNDTRGARSAPNADGTTQSDAYAAPGGAAVDHPLLTSSDIEVGSWDFDTQQFVANAAAPNAVQVLVRRDETSGDSLKMFFGRLFGVNTMGLQVSAVAAYPVMPVIPSLLDPSDLADFADPSTPAPIDEQGRVQIVK